MVVEYRMRRSVGAPDVRRSSLPGFEALRRRLPDYFARLFDGIGGMIDLRVGGESVTGDG
jgi:hypothetical protein